jgi:magnesium transporter
LSSGPHLSLDEMRALAAQDDLRPFVERAVALHPSDLADVLADLDESTRVRVVAELPTDVASRALAEMEQAEHPEELLLAVGPDYAADLVEQLPRDDAVDIIAELEPADREAVLSEVADRSAVDRLLEYAEDSAGRLMDSTVVAVREDATLAQALDEIRRQSQEHEALFIVYVIGADRRLTGTLPIARLVVASPVRRVSEIMEEPLAVVRPEQDQEQVARLMARYNLAEVPVVDAGGRLLGRVTFDDVIDVVEAETTEDILKFGGVNPEEGLGAPWTNAVRSRLPWLYVNLITAFMAGTVVFLFQGTISRIVALAVWMPIIAGMGGNTGTQALAVTVRRLALGQVPRRGGLEVIGKEVLVGGVNGVAIGIVVGAIAWAIGEGPALGLVVMLAMLGNLAVAGFAGAFIPLLLERLRVDPAIASSIFVTAFTDIFGFLLLLGLGTVLLL